MKHLLFSKAQHLRSISAKKIILSLSISFGCFYAFSQNPELPVFISDSLDSYITRGMKDWEIPGLSVAIIKNGEVVFIKGYGVTSLNGGEPVDENTVFMIGSNTKSFTATALAILQESKAMNLNDKVQKWMPEFRLKDSLASKEINIADLLSHKIGFETFQGDFTYWGSNLSREQVIQKMGLIDPPYSFRTNWGYCNAAYVAAGELIPRIIGKSWEETVRDSILIPLKMNRTLMNAEQFDNTANRAFPHTIVNNELKEIPILNLNNLAPAGSMISSAKDMSLWLIAQLNNGKIDGEQIIAEQAIKTIRTAHTILNVDPRNNKNTHFYLYGMGLLINDRNNKVVYSHGGAVDGFLSSMLFIPEEKLGIVVLTNTDQNVFFQDLTDEIQDAFLGLPYQSYSNTSLLRYKNENKISDANLNSLRQIVNQDIKPNLPLLDYTGSFRNEVYGTIKILEEENYLNIYFSNHPELIGKLEHIQNDNFLCTYSNPVFGIEEIQFKIENGNVSGLILRISDFVEYTPYEFTKISL